MNNVVNGFTDIELFNIYHIIKAYEDRGIKKMKEGEVLSKYPILKDIKSIIKNITCDEKTKDEIDLIDIQSLDNEFYFTSWNSELLGVLYHLRNAIAHAKMIKVGDNVTIMDYNLEKSPKCTAKGIFKYEYIEEIVNIMKQII